MLLVKLFVTFFKIGLFGFGGGYGMLSVIQGEVVTRYGWLSMAEFTDIVAISQMTPGPIGINSATYVGYTAMNNAYGSVPLAVIGSLTASFAVMLPSLVLMLIISRYLMKYSNSRGVNAVFRVLRPAVVGLIASAALLLMSSENYGSFSDEPLRFVVSVLITIAAFVAMRRKVSPILILVVSAIFGAVFYSFV
ncbi:MAG: chromate transporter [Bacteroidaceae bacterium]|nr:chromate transporter [Bacteroidaceae bacterium]